MKSKSWTELFRTKGWSVEMKDTKIEWTHRPGTVPRTWNPINGCRRKSPGCANCYAEAIAARFSANGQPYHGLAIMTQSGPRWTGKMALSGKHLFDPISWREPATVFPSMSDWFHEDVPDEWLDRLFAIIAGARRHKFLILTKRAERMFRYLVRFMPMRWPLPNVELGVSVESQEYADERIPWLLKTPAAIRFVSYEPALDVVDFGKWLQALDQVIVGGESGPGARPFNVQWARNTVRQCRAAGTACFVKQMGSVPIAPACRQLHYEWGEGSFDYWKDEYTGFWRIKLKDRKGGAITEWPEYLRVREFPR